MAAEFGQPLPWDYWRVKFAEKGICRWDEFEDMELRDVRKVIAIWDGIARADKHGSGTG